MPNNEQTQRPYYFNLNNDGDNAVVKILHTSTKTIESIISHKVEVDGKKRRVRCLGENCPLCKSNQQPDNRIYVHLFDYTDNREKVWERTDKILPQLESIEKSWGPLNSAVVRITRKGNEFPKYTIDTLNPMQYTQEIVGKVDEPIAKYYSMNRKAEDIETFMSTGKFPEKKPYVPKSEYFKAKQQEEASSVVKETTPLVVDDNKVDDVFTNDVDNSGFDPFADLC